MLPFPGSMPNFLRTLLLLGGVAVPAAMVGWMAGGGAGALLGALLGAGAGVLVCLVGERVVLRLYGAREVDAQGAPHLLAMVREMAALAGLPAPRVFLLDADAANAFTVGRGRARAALVLTSGILRLLDERELRAVLAHELAHVLRGDMLPGTFAAALGGVLAAASQTGLGAPLDERARPAPAWQTPLWLLLAPLAALLAQLGAAARRELAADRLAARLCGDPLALAGALQRLQAHADERHGFAQAGRYPAGAQMMVCNPLGCAGIQRLFDCHPSMQRRIQALHASSRLA